MVEWYDFFVFSTASDLLFPESFFPRAQQATGLLASFATFWVVRWALFAVWWRRCC
ncbi:hypothetical protein [Streptomyces sp. 8N706]|uniref:hypothetical protein n=1 Tax=Streptomyces sp. 8N706 TaxID=3457416 RepID=UPI003FD05917